MAPTTPDFISIVSTQSTVNGVLVDYRFSIGAGNVWRYHHGNSDKMSAPTLAKEQASPDIGGGGCTRIQLIVDYDFSVTDGHRTFVISVSDTHLMSPTWRLDALQSQILTFAAGVPPADTDLRVVDPVMVAHKTNIRKDLQARVICFTPGTWIRTPIGPKPVEQLGVDDLILTKDNGACPLRWIGRRRITGARLIAMSDMRPIRIRKGALGSNVPDRDMWVSPGHRMAVGGPRAQELFNTPEVLVTAKDLVNDRNITVDYQIRQTVYIHLLFDQHQVIWANGAETESFHPNHVSATAVPKAQLAELFQIFPHIESDPHSFGAPARRLLSQHEAAVMIHAWRV